MSPPGFPAKRERSPRANTGKSLEFLQAEGLAFGGVFFPTPVRSCVEMGLVALACSQNEASVDDLPTGGVKNHNSLIATTWSERRLSPSLRRSFRGQRKHTTGILTAFAQDRIASRRVGLHVHFCQQCAAPSWPGNAKSHGRQNVQTKPATHFSRP